MMNTVDKFFDLKPGMEVDIPASVTIYAAAEEIERLRAAGPNQLSNTALVPVESGASLPIDTLDPTGIAVLEVDPEIAGSIQRLAELRHQFPNLPVVAALRNSDVSTSRTLLKQGVTDVVSLPFKPTELVETLLEVAAQTRDRDIPVQGELITVVRGSGGVGATTVLVHLAAELGERVGDPMKVCLLDLDLQSGDAASFLGLAPGTGMSDVLSAGARLDATVLRDASVDSGQGFRLLAAPREIEPLEQVNIDQLLRVVMLARQQFDYVLIDLPANWTNWSLSAALACSRLLFLTDSRFSSLRQTKRRIDLFTSMNLERERIGVVVNRLEKKLFASVGTDTIAETLRTEVVATLAADPATLGEAHDKATTAAQINSRSKFARDIVALADYLLGEGQ